MSSNFLRDYILIAKIGTQVIEIKPPLRIQFDGIKNTGQGAGIGANGFNFKIYGLSRVNRDLFFRNPTFNREKQIAIYFKVGYSGNLKTVFSGIVHRGTVTLEDEGYVVNLNAFSGGSAYLESYTSKTVTTKQGAIDALVDDMGKVDPTAKRGKIEKFADLVRPKVMVGATAKILADSLNEDEEFFIDNGFVHVKKKSKAISKFIPIVDAESGLKTVPERDFFKVNFETVLNPDIVLGANFKLESFIAPQYNGVYQAIVISYKGDTEGSDWSQSVTGAAR